MAVLDDNDCMFLGIVLEAVCWGIYAVVFALYLNLPKASSNRALLYPLSILFVLCTTFFAVDSAQTVLFLLHSSAPNNDLITNRTSATTTVLYAFIDFTSQCVLIYRCWVVWNKALFLAIIPGFLALASFATSLALSAGEILLIPVDSTAPTWFIPMGTASFAISLAVNVIITGILILKLAITHRESQRTLGRQEGRGLNLVSIMSLLIESAMLTFIAQLLWVVLFNLQITNNGFDAIDGVVAMTTGIAPTAVIVRVALGKSYGARASNVVETTMKFEARGTREAISITTASGLSKNSSALRFDGSEKIIY